MKNQNAITCDALVVGGGIAGIQSALDLAESGYFVYLLEKGPGIGGNMARRDAEKVVRSLVEMGLPSNRINVAAQTSGRVSSNEVHVYVR